MFPSLIPLLIKQYSLVPLNKINLKVQSHSSKLIKNNLNYHPLSLSKPDSTFKIHSVNYIQKYY